MHINIHTNIYSYTYVHTNIYAYIQTYVKIQPASFSKTLRQPLATTIFPEYLPPTKRSAHTHAN